MEKKPTEGTETAQADVAEKATMETKAEETKADESSSSQAETDYDALIEAEKKRVPDVDKAKEAFKKREEKRAKDESDTDDQHGEVDLDKPMTRREMDEYLARRTHQIVTETQSERISEIANELAENPKEAEFIMAIHKNRVFPEGMSLRDQLRDAYFIANGQRLAAKNAELARKVQSKETASKDTASTHHDPQEGTAVKIASDLAMSLKRSGFEYENSTKLYVKKLPKGKKLYKEPATGKTWMV